MKELAKNYIEFNEKAKESKSDILMKVSTLVRCDFQFDVDVDDTRIEITVFDSPNNQVIMIDYSEPLNEWHLSKVNAKGAHTQTFIGSAQAIVDKLNGKDLPMPAKTLITINPNEG